MEIRQQGVGLLPLMERILDALLTTEIDESLNLSTEFKHCDHRRVYRVARQGDDAKVWTSALFVNFK